MLYLKEANYEDIEKEYVFVKDMPLDENGLPNEWHGISREEFEKTALPTMIAYSKGEQLPEGFVPETFLFLWNDDEIVGQFRIRQYLCESLREGAGHIGYFIHKEHRGKGYGTEGLRLTLQVAGSIIPEKEIYLRVNKDNPASLKVMLYNGGYICKEDDAKYYVRIKKQTRDDFIRTIRFYEELSFNSHPSLQTQYYDGWMLRFSNGYTNRANSVNMLYPSTLDLQTKIAFCEERYFNQHQPCVFKVTEGSEESLDLLLEDRGYQVVTPTDVMRMDLTNRQFEAENCIMTEQATEEWLHTYFTLEHCNDEKKQTTAKQMLRMIQNKTLYCRIVENGQDIACASAVIERGYMTLLHVIVDEAYRGRGYGRKVCESLLAAAVKRGAHTAYLQVVRKNSVAIHLYEMLGYQKLYSYWYRVKSIADSEK